MDEYLCNLVVPGFPKSGTSSLHEYLNDHPLVCMSRPKECHYFARSTVWSTGVEYHNSLFSDKNGDEIWYGESSTIYCVWDEAIARISRCLTAPKIILLLRHPMERTISHYRWLYARGLEHRPFLQAIEEDGYTFDPDTPITTRGNYLGFLTFSMYSIHVPKWLHSVGCENVLLLNSDTLRRAPEATLDRVWSFLGIDRIELPGKRNENATAHIKPAPKERALPQFLSLVAPAALKRYAKRSSWIVRTWQCMLMKRYRPSISPPPITKDDRKQLAELLKKEISFYEQTFA